MNAMRQIRKATAAANRSNLVIAHRSRSRSRQCALLMLGLASTQTSLAAEPLIHQPIEAAQAAADFGDAAAFPPHLIESGSPAPMGPLLQQALDNIKQILTEDRRLDWVATCALDTTMAAQDKDHYRATYFSVDKTRISLHLLDTGSRHGVSVSEINSDVSFDLADLDPGRVLEISTLDQSTPGCSMRTPYWMVVLKARGDAFRIQAKGIWKSKAEDGTWLPPTDYFAADRDFSNGYARSFTFFVDREDVAKSLQRSFIRAIILVQSSPVGDLSQ